MRLYILLALILLFYSELFSQYTPGDRQLALTTFSRTFDKSIILSNLNSNDPQKVNAALLSIAQSSDTLFARDVTSVNFVGHYRYVCFALSEMGPCFSSSKFLWERISDSSISEDMRHDCLAALGSTGRRSDFDKLAKKYEDGGFNFGGISISVYNFYTRRIIKKDDAQKILLDELTSSDYFSRRNFEALFALYRTGGSIKAKDILLKELNLYFKNEDHQKRYTQAAVPYLLGCMREIKYFPEDTSLFNNIMKINGFPLKTEAVKYLTVYNYKSVDRLNSYLSILNDPNGNIARQAALSLRNINIDEQYQLHVRSYIDSVMINGNLSPLVKGELLISLIKQYRPGFVEVLKKFRGFISPEYLYKLCGNYTTDKSAFNLLVKDFTGASPNLQNSILESLLEFQKNFGADGRFTGIIFKVLSSSSPALISICADGLDSAFVSRNQKRLISTVNDQVNKFKNNPDYLESLQSLISLSGRISKDFSSRIIGILKDSKIYAVKKTAFLKSGLNPFLVKKDTTGFSRFWSDAFKYKSARVVTPSGNFTMKFFPGIAPISVGNFCRLAEKGFFDNIVFHRVVPGFVIQGGDPEGNGWGGPGYDITSEFSPLNYNPGMVGMASAGKDTEGSQWFVTTGNFPHLDGRYTIFGEVTRGMEIVNRTLQGDKIIKVIPEN